MSPTSCLRRRLQAGDGEGDRGSLVLAMLVMLVATSVAALILPVLLTSVNSARFDERRTRQLATAQSGVETVLARIRAATTTTAADGTNGDRTKLPCGTTTGTVLGATTRFQVTADYYAVDPALNPTVNALTCVPGFGTPTVPGYARLTATGTDAPGNTFPSASSRTVTAVYVVKTTNANIVGGLFRVNKLATSQDLCLDAGSGNPTTGTVVTMQACNSTKASQKWAYNATLTVSLVASRTVDPATGAVTTDGMCIDGTAPEKAGTALVLRPCGTATTLTQQQWSMNDNAGMQGTNDAGTDLNSLCWNVRTKDTVGSPVVLGTQCAGVNGYDNVASWQPEAAVGAGRSGAAYNELVNYAQFGRCLDVTNQNVNSGYLIAWPCKQNPDPTKVTWNQRWALPAVTNGVGKGQVTVTAGGTTYCLVSPRSTAAGRYVTVTACPAAPTPATTWTVRTKVATYAASYQLEDTPDSGGTGLCLQVTDPTASPPDLATEGTGISKVVVRPCGNSTLQKWNAPPNLDAPSVRDQTER